MDNNTIALAIEELATLVELDMKSPADKFKVKNYRKSAEEIRKCKEDVSKMNIQQLQSINGVGKSISSKVIELVSIGKISKAEKLRLTVPPIGISEFTKLRGIGPVSAKRIWKEYNVITMDELLKLESTGVIKDSSLIESIRFYRTSAERILLSEALRITEPIIQSLRDLSSTKKIVYGGSISRFKETIADGDIVILVDKDSVTKIVNDFLKFADEIIVRGDSRVSIMKNKFRVDLTIVTNEMEWGGAILHAEGPKEWNIKLRQIAISKGLTLNDKGLWRGEVQVDNGAKENICKLLDIIDIPPELKELAASLNGG